MNALAPTGLPCRLRFRPKGVEGPDDIETRHNLLRQFGYER